MSSPPPCKVASAVQRRFAAAATSSSSSWPRPACPADAGGWLAASRPPPPPPPPLCVARLPGSRANPSGGGGRDEEQRARSDSRRGQAGMSRSRGSMLTAKPCSSKTTCRFPSPLARSSPAPTSPACQLRSCACRPAARRPAPSDQTGGGGEGCEEEAAPSRPGVKGAADRPGALCAPPAPLVYLIEPRSSSCWAPRLQGRGRGAPMGPTTPAPSPSLRHLSQSFRRFLSRNEREREKKTQSAVG